MNSNMSNSSIDTNKTAIQAVNSSAEGWGVNPLPSLTYLKNGTFKAADNSTFTRAHTTAVGNVALVPFIYMLMSLAIILVMIHKSISWIRGISSGRYKWEPELRSEYLNTRMFESQLRRWYPKNAAMMGMSFDETVARSSGMEAEDIIQCGQLIRAKFRLDLQVYNLRDAREVDRPIVESMKKRSEGAMSEIRNTTARWKAARTQWSAEEWDVVKEIHDVAQTLGTK
jgi:hypothetical protein